MFIMETQNNHIFYEHNEEMFLINECGKLQKRSHRTYQ